MREPNGQESLMSLNRCRQGQLRARERFGVEAWQRRLAVQGGNDQQKEKRATSHLPPF
jgi:hypothetical protein